MVTMDTNNSVGHWKLKQSTVKKNKKNSQIENFSKHGAFFCWKSNETIKKKEINQAHLLSRLFSSSVWMFCIQN